MSESTTFLSGVLPEKNVKTDLCHVKNLVMNQINERLQNLNLTKPWSIEKKRIMHENM